MANKEQYWIKCLENIFGGYVGQNSLEEAADDMADQFDYDHEFREGARAALQKSLEVSDDDLPLVISAINTSGITVTNRAEAMRVLSIFKDLLRASCARAGVQLHP